MNDLIEFLTKCNDEDEAAAKTALKAVDISGDLYGTWAELVQDCVCDDYAEDHVRIHDPARVLRECAARRKLIARAQHAANSQAQFHLPGGHEVLKAYDDALLIMAQSYVDRPGFKDEWRVS